MILSLHKDMAIEEYRYLREKVMWTWQTRLEIAGAVAENTQVSENRFNADPSAHKGLFNSEMRHLRNKFEQYFCKKDRKRLYPTSDVFQSRL